jgi:NAD(P)-dependent dehydrogenase (short-subunit alcohol dehydrogenase family)
VETPSRDSVDRRIHSRSLRLDGRIAIVTGAGRGIGAATARELARLGAAVVVNDVDEAAAHEVAERIVAGGGRANACIASVSEREAAQRIAAAAEALGGLDILVNNAGLASSLPLAQLDAEHFERVADSHMLGTFLCTRAALPRMLAQRRGRIVNLVSRAGLIGSPGTAAYAAGKGAVFAFTNVAARDLAGTGITVNAVNPAATLTRMLTSAIDALAARGGEDARRADALRAGLQAPEEIAPAIAALCADEAGHVTGQIFYVARGQLGLFAPLAVTQSTPRAADWSADDALAAIAKLALHPLDEPYR